MFSQSFSRVIRSFFIGHIIFLCNSQDVFGASWSSLPWEIKKSILSDAEHPTNQLKNTSLLLKIVVSCKTENRLKNQYAHILLGKKHIMLACALGCDDTKKIMEVHLSEDYPPAFWGNNLKTIDSFKQKMTEDGYVFTTLWRMQRVCSLPITARHTALRCFLATVAELPFISNSQSPDLFKIEGCYTYHAYPTMLETFIKENDLVSLEMIVDSGWPLPTGKRSGIDIVKMLLSEASYGEAQTILKRACYLSRENVSFWKRTIGWSKYDVESELQAPHKRDKTIYSSIVGIHRL